MLKIALLSGWHVHAVGYCEQIRARTDAAITAVWDEDPARGKTLAERFHAAFEPDLDAVLARGDVDAVCVNAPTSMHKEVITKAAKAGKHIFTEKVLAANNADANAIREAVAKGKGKFCISFPHRGAPYNLFAKEAMDKGLLGDVTLLRVRNAHNGSSAGWLPPHFYDKETCGGGAMMDLGAHPMYLARWIMGKPQTVTSVFTAFTNHAVEDNAVSLLKYESGAIAIVETGFVSEHSPFSLELYGTKGSLFAGGPDNKVKFMSSASGLEYGAWVLPEKLPDALPGPIDMWIEGVLYDKPIPYCIDAAVGLTELMDAAYRSHASGQAAAV